MGKNVPRNPPPSVPPLASNRITGEKLSRKEARGDPLRAPARRRTQPARPEAKKTLKPQRRSFLMPVPTSRFVLRHFCQSSIEGLQLSIVSFPPLILQFILFWLAVASGDWIERPDEPNDRLNGSRRDPTDSNTRKNATLVPFSSATRTTTMITDALEFPCVEATRCHLTEKENGLRLTLTRIPKSKGETLDSFRIDFTKERNRQTEWYVDLGTVTTEEGATMRSASFRHVETGKYLHTTSDGTVATQDFTSNWTTWLMEPIIPMGAQMPWRRSRSDSMGGSPTNGQGQFRGTPSEVMSVCYALLPRGFASRKLVCNKRSTVDGGGLELTTADTIDSAMWELEFTSGELCFISNPVLHSQVRCNLFGQLHLSSVFQGWEVFRFIEVGYGHVVISSWTHSHKYLSSDPDGKVFTSENRLGHWEKWKLEKCENGVHIISVAHQDRYLAVGKEEGETLQTTTKPGDFAKWHLDAAHCNLYYLSSVGSGNKLQVSSRPKGPFLSKYRRDWEEWKMERTTNGDITLWSKAHDKYMGCNSHGELHMTTTKGDWSMWEMEESPHGGIFLKSKVHQRVLSVQKDVLTTTQDAFTENETFRLEPRLPMTISGPRIAALTAAGAVGVVLTVFMPYAVLGAMETAGLAATQLTILAGFSAEAVAGASGGMLLGAGVLSTTAAAVKDEIDDRNLSPTAEVKDDYLIGVQRPISAWRTW